MGLSRNTLFNSRRQIKNGPLSQEIHRLTNRYNSFGYRRIHALLCKQQGLAVNVKRVHRLWKQEGLQVRKRKRRKRKGGYTVLIPQQAKSLNHVWTVDFVYDTLRHGRSIRLLSVVDEYTRECLALWVE